MLAVIALQSSGCITYTTYKKLDTGHLPDSGSMLLVGLGETFAGDMVGLGMGDFADKNPDWAPQLETVPTWLLIGNATVLGIDAICATALYFLGRGL